MRIATIDIGTNTVLMLIADIESNNNISVVNQYHNIARLGQGVDKSGLISDDAAERLLQILQTYKSYCNEQMVEKIIAVGTSVFRDASNSNELVNLVFQSTEIMIKVISGIEEAKLSYSGAVESVEKCLLIDIGGGSTEIIVGKDLMIEYVKSIDIGAVRITEKFFTTHPPSLCQLENAKKYILDSIKSLEIFDDIIYYFGVAGTVTTIAATSLSTSDDNVNSYEGMTLNIDDIKKVYNNYLSSDIDEIINKYKVHPKRADVITAGVLILLCIFEKFKIKNLFISSKGIRFGLAKNSISYF